MNRRTASANAKAPRKKNKKSKNLSGQQPLERKLPPSLPVGNSAENDLRLYTPVFQVEARKKLVYYASDITAAGTAGALTTYVFSANGLYDPDITSGGHQCIGWDQMMIFFEQATCLSSKITVQACGNGAQACNVSVSLSPDTSAAASVQALIENGLIARAIVDGRGSTSYGTGTRIKSVSLDCDVAKYFGRPSPREIVNDPDLLSTSGANPTEQVYFIVNTWGFAGFTDNTSVAMDAVLEFDVVFWEPRKASTSLQQAAQARSGSVPKNVTRTRYDSPVRGTRDPTCKR